MKRAPTAGEFTPQRGWKKFGGEELEPFLRSGAIALLDAQWLIKFANSKDPIITIRQKLPTEAFLSCDQVIDATTINVNLPVIVVSHMWLTQSHPDPKGTTLQRLAQWCQDFVKESGSNWGIFWDYASLYQHPDPSQGVYRSDDEEEMLTDTRFRPVRRHTTVYQ